MPTPRLPPLPIPALTGTGRRGVILGSASVTFIVRRQPRFPLLSQISFSEITLDCSVFFTLLPFWLHVSCICVYFMPSWWSCGSHCEPIFPLHSSGMTESDKLTVFPMPFHRGIKFPISAWFLSPSRYLPWPCPHLGAELRAGQIHQQGEHPTGVRHLA